MTTVSTYSVNPTGVGTGAVRENLEDIIYNISPTMTPFMSNVGRGNADSSYFEWQTDTLDAANGSNAAYEGQDAVDTSFTKANRVGNYTQISQKTINVTGTSGAVDSAGMKTIEAYLLAKRGRELKRDMETILTSNQAAVVGDASSVARKLAGLPAWITTNVVTNGVTTAPTLSSTPNGYPNTAWTLTSGAAYATVTSLQSALQKIWTNGGEPRMVMVGPVQKVKYSAFAGIAINRVNIDAAKQTFIVGAADVFVSDFGNVDIVPNRFSPEAFSLFVDPEYAKVVYLRPFQRNPLAKTGDSRRTQLLVEYTLQVNTEKAHGAIVNQLTT
jgi:hypothetical protein